MIVPIQHFWTVLEILVLSHMYYKNIRIDHECEGWIEKSVPRITVWHHEACRVMTNGDPEGRIPYLNNGFFFLFFILK